jgi:hypothetical protein
MRPRIFQIHIKAIDEAWQSIRRLEEDRQTMTSISAENINSSAEDKWCDVVKFHREMILSKSTWKEFCRFLSQSPLSLAKSAGKGALLAGVPFMLFGGVFYFALSAILAADKPKDADKIKANLLSTVLAISALAACAGAAVYSIYDSRLRYVNKVCREVIISEDVEAQTLSLRASTRNSGARSRLTMLGNSDERGEPRQISRA